MLPVLFVLVLYPSLCQSFAFFIEKTSFHDRSPTIKSRRHVQVSQKCRSLLSALHGTKQVVVVGGGIGGLAVASRIAASNKDYKVTIVEKNSFVGGRCGSFERQIDGVGTFRHERGPSLLLLPDVYRDLFYDCTNQKAETFGLTMAQCVPAYQVVFDDGDSISVGFPRTSMEDMGQAEIESRKKMHSYEPNGAKKWDEYMMATSAFLDAGLSNFIEERLDLASFPNFIKEALRDFGKVRARLQETSLSTFAVYCASPFVLMIDLQL
jgi:phytoene desaturase (3,4-didehydrolycopene-forming)